MKSEQRKEIEAKWQRLISGNGKSPKPTTPEKTTVVSNGTKVIRRRKGRQDLQIA